MVFNLNRTSFFSSLHEVPICVIKALVFTCGKKVTDTQVREKEAQIITFLKNFREEINDDFSFYTTNDLIKIATYTGNSDNWDRENLIKAFKHILSFDTNPDIELEDFRISYKNNNNIYNYDIIMCYKYCIHHEIELEKYDTEDSIARKITEYLEREQKRKYMEEKDSREREREDEERRAREREREDEERRAREREREDEERRAREREEQSSVLSQNIDRQQIYSNFFSSFDQLTNQELFHISKYLKESPSEEVEDLPQVLKRININFIISKSVLSSQEAITYGLKFLSFDLRKSPSPVEDLKALNLAIREDKDFVPDRKDEFAIQLAYNKNIFYLDRYWKKDLKEFNNNKILDKLYQENFMQDKSLEKLEEIYSNHNFHRGWLPPSYFCSLSKKDLKDVRKNLILSYGIPGERIISFIVSELVQFFKNKGLIDPINERLLDNTSKERLSNLCKIFPGEKDYIDLKKILQGEEIDSLEENEAIASYINKYLFASDILDSLFNDIFKIAMYIRGWGLDNNLMMPLSKDRCFNYNERQKEIDINIMRVAKRIKDNYNAIRDPQIKNIMTRLPLVKYNSKGAFSLDSSYKLWERVNILIHYSQESLITNIQEISNQLLYSSYYYVKETSKKELFDIKILEVL